MGTASSNIGPYSRYEIPFNLLHTFYEADGTTAIDLTGFAVEVNWWIKGQSPADAVQVFSGTLFDPTNGVVSVPWDTAPTVFAETGLHEIQIYVGNGTYRYASEIFRFMVRESVATTAPVI